MDLLFDRFIEGLVGFYCPRRQRSLVFYRLISSLCSLFALLCLFSSYSLHGYNLSSFKGWLFLRALFYLVELLLLLLTLFLLSFALDVFLRARWCLELIKCPFIILWHNWLGIFGIFKGLLTLGRENSRESVIFSNLLLMDFSRFGLTADKILCYFSVIACLICDKFPHGASMCILSLITLFLRKLVTKIDTSLIIKYLSLDLIQTRLKIVIIS
jgi:hypothetical protein